MITGVPDATPVTTPLDEPTVACAVLLLVHVPPAILLLNVVVWPTHTVGVPVITDGAAFTVNDVVREHPVLKVYVMVTVPAATPVTIPLVEPTVAVSKSLLLQVPPPVASVSVLVDPTQTFIVPVIVAGSGLTVTVTAELALQPDVVPVTVYVVVTVGVAVGLEHVLHDSVADGDHE